MRFERLRVYFILLSCWTIVGNGPALSESLKSKNDNRKEILVPSGCNESSPGVEAALGQVKSAKDVLDFVDLVSRRRPFVPLASMPPGWRSRGEGTYESGGRHAEYSTESADSPIKSIYISEGEFFEFKVSGKERPTLEEVEKHFGKPSKITKFEPYSLKDPNVFYVDDPVYAYKRKWGRIDLHAGTHLSEVYVRTRTKYPKDP